MSRCTVVLFLLFLAFASSVSADIEQHSNGVVRDGLVFVPLRGFATAFGATLTWGGHVRTVVLPYGDGGVEFELVADAATYRPVVMQSGRTRLPAISVDAEVYVPLAEAAQAIEAKWERDAATKSVVVTRDETRLIVHLDTPARPARKAGPIALPVYRYSPSEGLAKTSTLNIDPPRTALIVIDFWGPTATPNSFHDNTAAMITLARRHGMPVVHLPHEGLGFSNMRVNPRILPIPDNEPVLNGVETIESYFAEHNMEIDTLLFTGYMASECLLISRLNSLNNVARRSGDRFRIVLMKDTTYAPYWSYMFVVTGVETRQFTSTLDDFAKAVGDPARSIAPIPPGVHSAPDGYRVDATFGTTLDFAKTALVVINAWESDPDAAWAQRVRYNTRKNIVPLAAFARERGMKVIHVPNGRAIDAAIGRTPSEPLLDSMDAIRQYLADHGITTVVYAGNLINTTKLFPPIDLWAFTKNSTLPVVSRLIEEAIIVHETVESLPRQNFRRVFLERATALSGSEHEVATFADLQRNANVSFVAAKGRVTTKSEGHLRLIASLSSQAQAGDVVIGDGRSTVTFPAQTLIGDVDLLLLDDGRVESSVSLVGTHQLLAAASNGAAWKRGAQNLVYSETEPLLVRFTSAYAIDEAHLRVQARNHANQRPLILGGSYSLDDGATFHELPEDARTYDRGTFGWSLRDVSPTGRAVLVKLTLHGMTPEVGIERVTMTFRSHAPRLAHKADVTIENACAVPFRIDPIKPLELQRLDM